MSLRYLALLVLCLSLAHLEHANAADASVESTEESAEAPSSSGGNAEVEDSYKEIVLAFKTKAEALLHIEKGQWLLALGGLVLGVVMVIEGEIFFKYLVVVVASFACFFSCMVVFLQKWDDWAKDPTTKAFWCTNDHYYGAVIVFLELTCILAYIVKEAYVGVQLVFGAAIGIFLTDYIHASFEYHFGKSFANNGLLLLAMVNVFSVFGYWVMATEKKPKLLSCKCSPIALTSAVIGGCLISASLAFFLEFTLVHFQPESLQGKLVLPPRDSSIAYVDFLRVLTRPTVREDYKDVGVFANSNYNTVYGYTVHWDRWIGSVLWFGFFCIGVMCQRKKTKQNEVSALEAPLCEKSAGVVV